MTSTKKETSQCRGCSSATPCQTSDSSSPPWRLERQEKGEVSLYIPVSVGELVDKLTILSIRVSRGQEKPLPFGTSMYNELRDLERCFADVRGHLTSEEDISILGLRDTLRMVNEELWALEDDLRRYERREDFGKPFVAGARRVYKTNDRRSEIKTQINELTKSAIKEYKNYVKYKEENNG